MKDVNDPKTFIQLYRDVQRHEDLVKAAEVMVRADHASEQISYMVGTPAPIKNAAFYDPTLDQWCFL